MSVTFWDGLTITVGIAFSKGAADATADGDFTDVSAYVRGQITIRRGRSSERDAFQPATCVLALSNRDRRFDPLHSAGPYYGNLKPNRRLRVQLTYGGSTSTIFHGYIEGWPQQWGVDNRDATVEITAHDWFKLAARTYLPESAYYAEVAADTPAAWYRLGEASGATVMVDSSGNGRDGTYLPRTPLSCVMATAPATGLVSYSTDGARALVQEYDATAGKYLFSQDRLGYALNGTNTYSVELWVSVPLPAVSGSYYLWGQTAAPMFMTNETIPTFTAQLLLTDYAYVRTLSYGDGSDGFYFAYPNDADRHHIVVTRSGATYHVYVDGVDKTLSFTSGPTTTNIAGGAGYLGLWASGAGSDPATIVVDELAIYTTALSSARVTAHYTAGATAYAGETVDARMGRVLDLTQYASVPATSLEASNQTVRGCDFGGGTTTLLAYLQDMERTEGGQARLFVAGDGTLTLHARYHDSGNKTVATAFTDASGTTLPYAGASPEYDDLRIINTAAVTRTDGVTQRYSDATSVGDHGTMAIVEDGLEGQSDAECYDRAVATVYAYKDPRTRVRALATFPRRAPATLMPVARTTEIGTRVSFRRLPVGVGSAFTQTLTVEGIEHALSLEGGYTLTFLTAPTDVADTWWILGDATYGVLDSTTRLGF